MTVLFVDRETCGTNSVNAAIALCCFDAEMSSFLDSTINTKGGLGMQPKVDHLAFVVKELDRSVKFYQDVFDGEVGRSRGFNEKDQKAGRPVHTLVKVGDYGFDLFVEDPKNPPKPDARFLHFAFSI